MLQQLIANGFAMGCLMAMMAVGFGMIYSTTRIFHIAYGATYIASAYVC